MASTAPAQKRTKKKRGRGVGGGRPTYWTKENRERILMLIRAGNDKYVAAGSCGIEPSTFRTWMIRGKDTKNRAFATFRTEILKALDEAETTYMGQVLRGSCKNWQAATWWLEHARSKRWRLKPEKPQTTANQQQKPTIIIQEASPPPKVEE